MTAVGIDFGTTNSVVAKWSPSGVNVYDLQGMQGPPVEWNGLGLEQIMPSVFGINSQGDGVFGWEAKTLESGQFAAVKRLFATQQDQFHDESHGSFAVEEIATNIFRKLYEATNDAPSQAVVTVPANSRGLARHRTKICAGMAGMEVLALINEPTAAAMAFASRNPGGGQFLVFDWGGGTLDVTILRSEDGIFIEEASKGLPTRGGIDFDARLSQALTQPLHGVDTWTASERASFKLDVERAKILLSTQESTTVVLPHQESIQVTRAMFEEAVASLIEESRGPIEQCLEDLGAGAGAIDAVIMVGGTSCIPAVQRFVEDLLGRTPASGLNPMTAVGEGAAIAAAILTGDLESNDFFVSTEHALGVVVEDPYTHTPYFGEVIPRNHKLPVEANGVFTPSRQDQETVEVMVIEGDPEESIDHPDNVILKTWDIPLPGDTGTPDRSFTVDYHLGVDGILSVTVTDVTSATVMLEDDVSYGVTADKAELVRISKRARDTVESGKARKPNEPQAGTARSVDPESAKLIQQAQTKVIPFLEQSEAGPIRDAATALENATGPEVDEQRAKLRALLAPYSYLF